MGAFVLALALGIALPPAAVSGQNRVPLKDVKDDRPKTNPRGAANDPKRPGSRAAKPAGVGAASKAQKPPSTKAPAVAASGQSERVKTQWAAAREAFEAETGYPNGRPGYLINYIVPLACGGTDTPGNLQWLTLAESRAKSKAERTACP